MRILFAGKDDFEYNRTKILLKGLIAHADVDVECFSIQKRDSKTGKILHEKSLQADIVYVPPFRHRDVRWIKRYSATPLVFDPLISKYLTKVVDFKAWYKAPMKYFLDWRALSKADLIIADTESMRKYYVNKWRLSSKSTAVLSIGYIHEDFNADIKSKVDDAKFHLGFYGSFVPLQGVDVIMEAASLLAHRKEIVFDIIGSGYELKRVEKLAQKLKLKNVVFHGWKKYEELSAAIASFDICLGIFGISLKSDLVVPNKVYHYAAMKKCIISKRSIAIQEIFTDKKDIVLIDLGPKALANEIERLFNDESYRNEIAQNAFELVSENYKQNNIADDFVKILKQFIHE